MTPTESKKKIVFFSKKKRKRENMGTVTVRKLKGCRPKR